MQWPTLSAQVLPLLTTISPLIGALTTGVIARWNPVLVRPMAISNSAMTVLLVAAALWLHPRPAAEGQARVRTTRVEPGIAWLAESNRSSETSSPRGLRLRFSSRLDAMSGWPALVLSLTVWAGLCMRSGNEPEPSSTFIGVMVGQSLLLTSFFCSDAVATLVFLEMSLVPIYLLIGRDGGDDRRPVAGQFWVWQTIGCTCSLLGVTLLAVSLSWMQMEFSPERQSILFDSGLLADGIPLQLGRNETAVQIWARLGPWAVLLLASGLAVRLPLFPCQGWYQSTLQTAPPRVAAMVASALPLAAMSSWMRIGLPLTVTGSGLVGLVLGTVSVIGIIQAAMALPADRDLRRCLSNLSTGLICLAGLMMATYTAAGARGAWLLLLAHGLTVPCGLVLIQGLESRFGTSDLARLPSVQWRAPRLMGSLILLMFGVSGIPVLFGFNAVAGGLSSVPDSGHWMLVGVSVGLVGIAAAAIRMLAGLMASCQAGRTRVTSVAGETFEITGRELLPMLPLWGLVIAMNALPWLFISDVDVNAMIAPTRRVGHLPGSPAAVSAESAGTSE